MQNVYIAGLTCVEVVSIPSNDITVPFYKILWLTQSSYVYQLEEQVKALSAAVSLPAIGADLNAFQHQTVNAEPTLNNSELHGSNRDPNRKDLESEQSPQSSTSKEVSGVNRHTRNVEFYGSSSSVVLLSRARKAADVEGDLDGIEDEEELVSSLHNPAFSPGDTSRSAATRSNRTSAQGSSTSTT